MSDHYRRDGTPYPEGDAGLFEWAKDMKGDRTVEKTTLPSGNRVSTVWLGLDHNYSGGRPLIFETMVFPPDSYADLDMARYSTEDEAKAGHAAMVEKWLSKEDR